MGILIKKLHSVGLSIKLDTKKWQLHIILLTLNQKKSVLSLMCWHLQLLLYNKCSNSPIHGECKPCNVDSSNGSLKNYNV